MGGQGLVPGIDPPVGVVEADGRVVGQQVHIGLPQAFKCPHILPVPFERIGEGGHFVFQQPGDDVLPEIMVRILPSRIFHQVLFQHILVENVDAHGRQVAFGLGGFFLEFPDAHILIGVHDPEPGRFGKGYPEGADGDLGPVLFVESQHGAVIHGIDMVPGQNQYILGIDHVQEIQVLVDGIRRALVPVGGILVVHVGRQHKGAPAVPAVQVPAASVADVPVQFQRLVLGQDPHGTDPGIPAVAEGKVNDPVFGAEKHRRFGHVFGQDSQTAALAAGQDHSQTFYFPQNHRLL